MKPCKRHQTRRGDVDTYGMTITTEDLPEVLVTRGCEVRWVTGDPAIPLECDPDGDPLTVWTDAPADRDAIEACAGELAWLAVVRHLRQPRTWRLPDGITIQHLDTHTAVLTGPGGQAVLRAEPR